MGSLRKMRYTDGKLVLHLCLGLHLMCFTDGVLSAPDSFRIGGFDFLLLFLGRKIDEVIQIFAAIHLCGNFPFFFECLLAQIRDSQLW